jgi:hypothetical protein
VPSGYVKHTKQQRLEAMVAMKKAVRRCPPPAKITAIYMFYDKDNDNLTRRGATFFRCGARNKK